MAGPGGREVGRLSIRVLPDTSRFAQSTQRFLDRVEQRARVQVDVLPDTRRFARAMEADLRRLSARLQVPVTPNTREFGADLRAYLARTRAAFRVPVTPDLSRFERQLSRELRGERLEVPVLLTLADGAVERLRAELARVRPPLVVPATVDIDRSVTERLSRGARELVAQATGVARTAASVAAVGVAAGAAVPVVAGLVSLLAQIAPAAAVGVSALVALQLASSTLKLAMTGVGEAVKAALDPKGAEAYAEAIKKLSPEARKFTDSLREMAPGLDKLRKQVQDRVFAGLNEEMERTAKLVAPALKRALLETGDSLNRMAKGVGAAARDLSKQGVLGRALDSATKSLENMEKVPGRVVTSLGLLAAASGPSLERIAKKADEVSARITDSLTDSFESGRLESAIDGAIDTFAQLGRIVRNIFGGIGNIIGGVTKEAGSLFFILERISQGFERFTASEEFQSVLKELVKTADELVHQALPLLREAFNQLAPVIKELGPPVRDFIRKIGPELKPVLQELGPILKDLAVIFREQLPFAIEVVKGALKALTLVLGVFRWVLHNVIVPAVRKVSQVLNSDLVKAIARTSEEAAAKIGAMVQKFERFRSAVTTVVQQVTGRLWGFISSIATFSRRIGTSIGSAIGEFRRLPDAVRAAVSEAILRIASLPSRAASALGDVGGVLFHSGRALIGGFISGILSRISDVASAARDAVSTARRFFPFSPAKEGPFSGRGWTLYSGQSLIEGLIDGIASRQPALRSEMRSLTSSMAAQLGVPSTNVTRSLSMAAIGGAAGAGLAGTSLRLVVDGQEFHAYVDDRAQGRVNQSNQELVQVLRAGRR